MLKIVQLEIDEHRDRFRQLLWEYISWMYPKIERELNLVFDTNTNFNELRTLLFQGDKKPSKSVRCALRTLLFQGDKKPNS